jgi:hypothetical protein
MSNIAREKIADIAMAQTGANDEQSWALADAILAALPDMIAPLDFQHVGQNPSHYDAGMLPTGHYKVRYSGAEEGWLVIRGHALIVGRTDTPDEGFDLANAHHRATIMAAFNGEAKT